MCLFCVYWLSKVKHFSNVRTFISDVRGYQLFELNLFERLFEGEIFDFQVKIIETCKANYVCLMIAWPDRCRAPGTKMGPDNWSSCHNVIVDDNRLIWHSSRRPKKKMSVWIFFHSAFCWDSRYRSHCFRCNGSVTFLFPEVVPDDIIQVCERLGPDTSLSCLSPESQQGFMTL